jgi:hypothetical protein
MTWHLMTDEALYRMKGDKFETKLSVEPVLRDGLRVGRKVHYAGSNLIVLEGSVEEPLPLVGELAQNPKTLRVLKTTFLKSRPIASKDLAPSEILQVRAGQTFEYDVFRFEQNQHAYVELLNPKAEGFIYLPHWVVPETEKQKEVKLAVPYFTQQDNWERYHGPGWRQCRLSSYCMMADYLLKGEITRIAKAQGLKEAEDLYGKVLSKYGDTTLPTPHTYALRDFGIEGYFSARSSIKDVIQVLDLKIPVPTGVAYKASGHWFCTVGYNDRGFWIHDPYGCRVGMTDSYENVPGNYDFVTWDFLKAKFIDLGPEAGHTFFATAVKGKPTGVPLGL